MLQQTHGLGSSSSSGFLLALASGDAKHGQDVSVSGGGVVSLDVVSPSLDDLNLTNAQTTQVNQGDSNSTTW